MKSLPKIYKDMPKEENMIHIPSELNPAMFQLLLLCYHALTLSQYDKNKKNKMYKNDEGRNKIAIICIIISFSGAAEKLQEPIRQFYITARQKSNTKINAILTSQKLLGRNVTLKKSLDFIFVTRLFR